jgi:hypothetical protein
MRLNKYFVGLSLAGVLLAHPVKALTDDRFAGPMNPGTGFIQEAATSFCYAGSTIDPTTGETVDFYNLCVDDLDFA